MFIVFQKEYLDVVLVPGGLLIMFLYHLFLLYKYLHHPLSTAIGFENRDKKLWVDKVIQCEKADDIKNALTVITSSISAATYMSTVSLTLCSLIGAWIANSNVNKLVSSEIIYGNTNTSIVSIKYLCLLACFLIAFSFFVQSARHFIHANYLISTPKPFVHTRSKVELEVIRGGEFWSLGLRALYTALSLLLWFFGPIPMFVSSVFTVIILCYHDSKKLDDQKDGV